VTAATDELRAARLIPNSFWSGGIRRSTRVGTGSKVLVRPDPEVFFDPITSLTVMKHRYMYHH